MCFIPSHIHILNNNTSDCVPRQYMNKVRMDYDLAGIDIGIDTWNCDLHASVRNLGFCYLEILCWRHQNGKAVKLPFLLFYFSI